MEAIELRMYPLLYLQFPRLLQFREGCYLDKLTEAILKAEHRKFYLDKFFFFTYYVSKYPRPYDVYIFQANHVHYWQEADKYITLYAGTHPLESYRYTLPLLVCSFALSECREFFDITGLDFDEWNVLALEIATRLMSDE